MIETGFYQDGDLENLFSLFQQWDMKVAFDFNIFRTSIAAVQAHSDYKILVAREQTGNDSESVIAGYAQIGKFHFLGFEPFYEVMQLLVSGAARRQGIGRMIMEKIEQIALSENIKVIKLNSQVHRSKAHVFYENLGYEFQKISKFYEKKL